MNLKKSLPWLVVSAVLVLIMVFQLVSLFTSFSLVTLVFFAAFGAALYFYLIPKIKSTINEPQS